MNTCTYVREIEWCDCVYSYITYVTGSAKPDHIVPATKMNDVIEVWSRSGENLEAIACIVLEIQSLEARRVG